MRQNQHSAKLVYTFKFIEKQDEDVKCNLTEHIEAKL